MRADAEVVEIGNDKADKFVGLQLLFTLWNK
jgi:hypothetical protein